MSRVITVDGPAGSGKGTVTKLVAKELNFYAMDTGTIYRSIALHCRRNNIAETDIELLKKELDITYEEAKLQLIKAQGDVKQVIENFLNNFNF